jgi:hypothetical protein
MGTIETDVKIGGTAHAGIPISDGFAGSEVELRVTGMTAHARSLLQAEPIRESSRYLEFPIAAADVPHEMAEHKTPIRSTQEDVPDLVQAIDRFVIGLAERIDAIQDAELQSSTGEIARLAGLLASESDRLGYPGLALVARNAVSASTDGKCDALQDAVAELTEIAQRVRQGHRGAA